MDGDDKNADNAPIWLARGSDIYDLIKTEASRKVVRARTVLIAQGQPVTYIYFVLKGMAQAFIYTKDGQKCWVADFKPGDLFGHTEILSGAEIEFEVRAENGMQLALLPAKTFAELMQEKPKLGYALSRYLAVDMGLAHTRLVELATLPTAGRVCAELLRMAKPIGKTPGTLIIRPHPVYSNFALRVHSTRETVSRTVSDLQKKGIVARETGALVILKPKSLRRLLK